MGQCISSLLAGFPNGNVIFEDGVLQDAVTTFIRTVTVEHSADHHSYAEESVNKIPWRIRIPPPQSNKIPVFNRKKIVSREDIFRHRMARIMFNKTTTISPLYDTKYTSLKKCQLIFIKELQELDQSLKIKRYVPFEDIAASLQY